MFLFYSSDDAFIKKCFFCLFILSGFLLINCVVFAEELKISVQYEQSITPFSVIPVFLNNVPEAVRSVKVTLDFVNEDLTDDKTENMSMKTLGFKKSHSCCLPILTNVYGEKFIVLQFFWLLELESVNRIINLDSEEVSRQMQALPSAMKVCIEYDKPLKPYVSIIKVRYDKCSENRCVDWVYLSEDTENKFPERPKNRKAIIYIHGIQSYYYNEIQKNLNVSNCRTWRNDSLTSYWRDYSSIDNCDHYEFNYDTYFLSLDEYAADLVKILEQSGIIENYDELYLISHSMGTIVAQYAMNTTLSSSRDIFGDHVEKNFLLSGALEGTYLVNVLDYLLANVEVSMHLKNLNSFHDTRENAYFFFLLQLINDHYEQILNENCIIDFLDEFTEFYSAYPLLACAMLSNFENIPILGGQLIPFEALLSMRYTDPVFLENAEKALKFKPNTFVVNDQLAELNQKNGFNEKSVIFTSYINNTKDFLNKIFLIANSLITNICISDYNEDISVFSSIPFVQYFIQRIISRILTNMAEKTNNPDHMQNNGLIPLWSGLMSSNNESVNQDNIHVYKGIDHLDLYTDKNIIKTINEMIQE